MLTVHYFSTARLVQPENDFADSAGFFTRLNARRHRIKRAVLRRHQKICDSFREVA